jgi:hypothetical protein
MTASPGLSSILNSIGKQPTRSSVSALEQRHSQASASSTNDSLHFEFDGEFNMQLARMKFPP